MFSQNVFQPIFHGYTTSSSGSHVDVLPNQAPQQLYAAHANPSSSNAVATSVGYIQPVQVQVSPQVVNAQNTTNVAPAQTVQVSVKKIFSQRMFQLIKIFI